MSERIPEATVVLVRDGEEVGRWELPVDSPDLGVVDAVARLELAARRTGGTLELRGDYAELLALLKFLGLADVVTRMALLVEVGGEPEGGEQRRVDEVVPPDDLAP